MWLRDNHVIAGMHINDWHAIEPIRAWVGREVTADLRDPGHALHEIPAPV